VLSCAGAYVYGDAGSNVCRVGSTRLLLALLVLPSAWGYAKLGPGCLREFGNTPSSPTHYYETRVPISQCKLACSAQADCAAFTFINGNGFSCEFFKCWSASTLNTCMTAQDNLNWITGCGQQLVSVFDADCPSTSESWYRADVSFADCPTLAPTTPAPTTPTPTEQPCNAAYFFGIASPCTCDFSPCSASLASRTLCTPTCSGKTAHQDSWTATGTRSCASGVITDTASCSENQCSVSAPTGGMLGTCTSPISSGSSCQPTCSGGFWIVGTTTSCLRGTLTAAQCIGVTSSAPPNTPSSGRSSLTIAGAGFSGYNDRNLFYGYQDATPSVRLETASNCLTSSWTSNTALTCLPQPLLSQQTQLIAATVTATVGTAMSRLFSYDGTACYSCCPCPNSRLPFHFHMCRRAAVDSNAAPAVSGEHAPNVPRSGAGSVITVTIAGLHFGPWNLTPTASLEDSDEAACTTSSWTSATAVACNARRLKSSRVREAMTVAGVVGTSLSFSFDGTAAAQSQPVCAASRI
jgi:hypothetical protein